LKRKSPADPSCIFGPVPSRRLNVSLGIDLIPYKTCTLDCIYCESGKTTDLRVRRQRFVDPHRVLAEFKAYLDRVKYPLDYVTLSGSGEPTLSADLGTVIRGLKKTSSTPVAVLTNGTLLCDVRVQEELMEADLVIPSLDAVDPQVFARINQPHPDLDLKRILGGLEGFARRYPGRLWVEVFLVRGVNDHPDHLDALRRFLQKIPRERVQLNSLDRPPAYRGTRSLTLGELEKIRRDWRDLPVEIIKRADRREDIAAFCRNLENSILNTIRRRPMTLRDLESFTGKEGDELTRYLDLLGKDQKIEKRVIRGQVFFCARK